MGLPHQRIIRRLARPDRVLHAAKTDIAADVVTRLAAVGTDVSSLASDDTSYFALLVIAQSSDLGLTRIDSTQAVHDKGVHGVDVFSNIDNTEDTRCPRVPLSVAMVEIAVHGIQCPGKRLSPYPSL